MTGSVIVKKVLVTFAVLLSSLCWAGDKDKYPLTITITEMKDVESQYESGAANAGSLGRISSSEAKYGHSVVRHVYGTSSDGLSYDLVTLDKIQAFSNTDHKNDFILPGTYAARVAELGLKICKEMVGTKCKKEVYFRVSAVKPAEQK